MPAGGATRGTGATSRLGNRYHGQPWQSSNGFDGETSIRSLPIEQAFDGPPLSRRTDPVSIFRYPDSRSGSKRYPPT